MLKTIGTRVQYCGPHRAIAGKTGVVVECRVGVHPERWTSVDFDGDVYDCQIANLRIAEVEALDVRKMTITRDEADLLLILLRKDDAENRAGDLNREECFEALEAKLVEVLRAESGDAANKIRVTLPPLFARDCLDCSCDVGEVVRETASSITLDMTPKQADELDSRASYYVDPHGPDAEGLGGLKASARATLKKLRAARA